MKKRVAQSFDGTAASKLAQAILDSDGQYVSSQKNSIRQLTGVKSKTKGCSLLHLAALCGNTGAAQVLLENGAIVGCEDVDRRTPLDYALWVEDNCKMIEFLSQRGADLNRVNMRAIPRETPLLWVLTVSPTNLQCLLDAGANVQFDSTLEHNALAAAIKRGSLSSAIILAKHRSANLDVLAVDSRTMDSTTIDSLITIRYNKNLESLNSSFEMVRKGAEKQLELIDSLRFIIKDKRTRSVQDRNKSK